VFFGSGTLEINFSIADSLVASANWRREQAIDFPEMATENFSAADSLDALAALFRLGNANAHIFVEYAGMFCAGNSSLVLPDDAIVAQAVVINTVGVSTLFATTNAFLEAVFEQTGAQRALAA
jgi:hypothetical protein